MTHPLTDPEALKQTLYDLSELPAAERETRILTLQKEEPALAAAVLALLPGALATSPGLVAPARWAATVSAGGWPERLGAWRVKREIGRGGMGVVLLGERADGAFDKQVAIKVLPPALVGSEGAARLAAEARALGRLEHPNIARLLDAGHDQGCAFLVMEYVDGVMLPIHVQRAGLDTAARLKLLLDLCAAVQFAHAQLLVHRDIKPANVLVDGTGRVRLLDFGIAKVLSGEEGTHTQRAACTPAYASPEQLLGQPVSVATDVFSLGVVLYELLTGKRPFGPSSADLVASGDSASTLATLRAVLEREPDPLPMQQARLRQDLRAIVLKALEKPRARRYASVEALAADLQAYLEGRPVTARVPSAAYRAGKFVSRHRWAVGGASLASVAVLSAAAWAQLNAVEARRQQAVSQARLEAVRSIANKVVFDYNRALEPVPGTLAVRRTLVADALSYLEGLSREASGDKALLADVADGFEAVGDMQGKGVTGANLGDLPGAQRSYERAETLRRGLCASGRVQPAAPGTGPAASGAAPGGPGALGQPGTARSACVALARTLVRLGDNAFSQGQLPQALPRFDEALALAEKAVAAARADAALQIEAQDVRFDAVQRLAGVSTRQTGEAYARGLALAETQLVAAQALLALSPGLKTQENLRVAQDFKAARLLAEGRADDALPAVRDALATARTLREMRDSRDVAVYLSTSQSRLAEIQAHRLVPAEARAAARESLDLLWARHRAEPEDRHLRARLANIGRRFGEVNNLIGDAEALATNARVLPELLAVSAVFTPADGPFYAQHLYLQRELALSLLKQGRPQAAMAQLADLPAALPPNPRAAADLAEAFLLKAQVQHALGDRPAAQATLRDAQAALQAQLQATPSLALARARLAWTQALMATWAGAGDAAAQAALAEARQNRTALAGAGQLTPWWQGQLAALGVR